MFFDPISLIVGVGILALILYAVVKGISMLSKAEIGLDAKLQSQRRKEND
jgi:hypothetical protein